MFGHATEDASPSDEGVFIDEADLADWYVKMQERDPDRFPPNTSPFGDPDTVRPQHQHPLGTKLMTYQDDDPNKSMRCEVRGSRWVVEYGDRCPVYVVRFRGLDGLQEIEMLSAHGGGGGGGREGERWSVGWDVPPPPAKEKAEAKPDADVNGEKGKS